MYLCFLCVITLIACRQLEFYAKAPTGYTSVYLYCLSKEALPVHAKWRFGMMSQSGTRKPFMQHPSVYTFERSDYGYGKQAHTRTHKHTRTTKTTARTPTLLCFCFFLF